MGAEETMVDTNKDSKRRPVRVLGGVALIVLGSGQIAEGVSHHMGYTLFFGIVATLTGLGFEFLEFRPG